jgi:WD40 repeat protein
MPRTSIIVSLALAVTSAASLALAGEEPHSRVITETAIGSIKRSEWIADSVVVSPDNRRVAYLNHVGWKSHVIVNGQKGKDYDGFVPGSITFSPDSQRLAYIAADRDTGKGFVVVDGKEWRPYDGFADGSLVFSPDSKRLAAVAFVGRRELSTKEDVIFGEERVTAVGEKYVVLIDDEEATPHYDAVAGLMFSPDSARTACVAKMGDKQCVVVDGKEGDRYDQIRGGTLIFSPDSKHVAYAASVDDHDVVVVDGQEVGKHLQVQEGSLAYSPDSAHFAYVAAEGPDSWFVVLDGQKGPRHHGIGSCPLAFSPDSEHLAWVAVDGGKLVVVVDGEDVARHDGLLLGPVWSPDSRRLAYAPKEGSDKAFFVVDGAEGKRYDALGPAVFSPDGKRMGHIARDGSKYLVVVDGEELTRHAKIGSPAPVFSPDGKHVAYPAHDRGKERVVLDGDRGTRYDAFVMRGGGKIMFDSPTSFHYIVIENYGFLLVEERIE